MKDVELYAKVRYAVRIEGLSERAAARRFGIDPRTVAKMVAFSVPPGYRRTRPPVRPKLDAAGVNVLPGRFLDFLDPWGNRIEIVGYENIQFTKAPRVLKGMDLGDLSKSPQAIKELAEKGMAPA